jgi:hypothetical protein
MTTTDQGVPHTWGRMTMSETMCPSHAFLSHPAGVRLILRGQSLDQLTSEGCCAIGHWLLGPAWRAGAPGPWIELGFTAKDRSTALVGWLNRILALAAVLHWAPVECQMLEATDSGVRARVRGVRLSRSPGLDRAILRASSHVEPDGQSLMADVLLRGPQPLLGPPLQTGRQPTPANTPGRTRAPVRRRWP